MSTQYATTPYEYHHDQLGVRSNVLFSGKEEDPKSLRLIGERGLRHRIEKDEIKRLRMRGPNHPALVKFNSIPHDWQKLLVETFGEPQKQIRQSLFEKHYSRDSRAIEFYTNYQLQDGKLLPDDVIDEYTLNASVLNTVERIYTKRYELRKSLRGGVADIWTIVTNECNRFRDIQSHTLPANAASLRRKLKDYKKEGYSALIHGNFCNKSALKVDETVNDLLNSMFAYQAYKPTATEISRQYDGFLSGYVEVINNKTGEIYDSREFPKLSQATITNWLAKWTNKAGTHTLRSGDSQLWMSKFKPYHSMKRPEFAGSIVSVDDRQPPFWYEKGKRVWMYGAIDLGSGAITSWAFGKTKESLMLEFYRQMVRNYTEWGLNLPYELEGEMSGNSQFLNTFLAEGNMFQKTHIAANVARAKRIEPYWKPLRYGTEKKREGWIARPNALSESNQAGPEKHQIIPYDNIIQDCLTDIENWNNTPHAIIKDKSCFEVLLEMQHPNMTPTNWRAFLPYLGFKTQTSCNTGIIKLNNTECLIGENGQIVFSDRLISLMAQVEGKDLDIYWLDDNYGKVLKALVYLRGTDRCVCEAISKPVYHRAKLEQTETDLEARELMSKYVASVNGFIDSKRKSIDAVTVIDNIPTTLNNKFKISGLRKSVTERIGPVETMPSLDDYENEDDLNNISTQFNKGLYDRF
jgi:hypothetical protein